MLPFQAISSADIQRVLDVLPEGVLLAHPDGTILSVNRHAESVFGYERGELIGATVEMLLPESARALHRRHRSGYNDAPSTRPMGTGLELRGRRKDGGECPVDISLTRVTTEAGPVVVAVIRDITEQLKAVEGKRELERRLAHAQKMEAVGRLAAGVAHDFNNLLTIIIGCCELMDREDDIAVIRRDVDQIRDTGARAAEITRQLLAFSRRQVITPSPLDLNAELNAIAALLRRLVTEEVRIAFRLAPDLWPICLDRGQLAQVAMNLAANVRDAMPRGGSLVFLTANVSATDADCARSPGLTPGEYVELTVSDTGTGMDETTLAHVFEPFFSTKPEGRGTGLGLATIYGIVKQNAGFVHVQSVPREGTAVTIRLPRYRGPQQPVDRARTGAVARGRETVLLVEDDEQVRSILRHALEHFGYTVIEANSAETAEGLFPAHADDIALLVTDIVMPVTSGVELAARLTGRKPGLRTLFISGYGDTTLHNHGAPMETVHFLYKPFGFEQLVQAVRTALDS